MGGVFSQSSYGAVVVKPTQLAEELRSALRVFDGPHSDGAQSISHRSAAVIKLLSNATRSDILTEHMLELVDSRWDEPHPGVPKVLAQLVCLAGDDQLHALAVTCILYQQCALALDFALQEITKRALREQRRGSAATASSSSTDTSSLPAQTSDAVAPHVPPPAAVGAQLSRLFFQACQAAPLPCLERLLALGWLDRRPAATAEQFRALMLRFAAQHRPLLSPEERLRRKLQRERELNRRKAAGAAAAGFSGFGDGDAKEQEAKERQQKKKLGGLVAVEAAETAAASKRLLIAFLRSLDTPVSADAVAAALPLLPIPAAPPPEDRPIVPIVYDDTDAKRDADDADAEDEGQLDDTAKANREARRQRRALAANDLSRGDLEACDSLRETLRAYVARWSQLEATVSEIPLSWTLARDRVRKHVCCIALCLDRKGMSFPAWSRVLSFAATPNMTLDYE
jgi:hypothetical protein